MIDTIIICLFCLFLIFLIVGFNNQVLQKHNLKRNFKGKDMNLLIEVGVEELPAIPFLKEYKNILPKWSEILKENRLNCECEFEFTPRRLVIFSKNFPLKQDDFIKSQIGAPKKVALNSDGSWSKAALSFAKKCNISENELMFKQIDKNEVLYFEEKISGKNSEEILPILIENWLKSLNFGKSMRWGDGEFEFIRPVRSVFCKFNNKFLDFEIFGVKSSDSFFPHRKFGYDLVKFENYFSDLQNNGVILKFDERKKLILKEFYNLEQKNNFEIEKDIDLLDEVCAITEYPKCLLCEFDKKFLDLPPEVIITSMKTNQRYFPIFESDKLSNKFIVVSNAISDNYQQIIIGNEKVLKARLSDAMFFWQSDNKLGLDPEKLKNITFLNGLGSVYDKTQREIKIAEILGEIYDENTNDLKRAVLLSKADLTTSMVGEFSELQGIMGGYYAKNLGEKSEICLGICEQYLPNGEQSKLPSTKFSSIVALANKLDNILSLFSINKIPSGNKDPYALRRSATGIIKIILNQNFNFDICKIIEKFEKNYAKFDKNLVVNFIFDRFYSLYDINPSIIRACLNSKQSDILKLNSNILALNEICNDEKFTENFQTFKRLSNIIKDFKICEVDEKLIKEKAEVSLFEACKNLNLDENKSIDYLKKLFGLKPYIDKFFDEIMINVDDIKLQNNRKSIIMTIYLSFLKIADIKEISL